MINQENISQIIEENKLLKEECSELKTQVNWLKEQLKINNKKTYATKSEQTEYVNEQLRLLHNEAEFFSDIEKKNEEVKVASHTRKKKAGTLENLPENIEKVVVEHKLTEEELYCKKCGKEMSIIGKEVKQYLKIKPAKVYIEENVYYSYACKNCQEKDIETPVVKTPQEKAVIKGSFASAEALAQIMVQKFVMYSPLYRQEQEFKRQGVSISRQTMSNWILKASDLWLKPIYERLKEELIKEEVLHADETTLQVLKEPGKKSQSKSYMWLYRTSGYSENPMVLYEYKSDRKADNAIAFLKDFKGYLHCDGYQGYHKLPKDIGIVGCWAHCRRRFTEAVEVLNKEQRSESLAEVGLSYCNSLYAIEKEIANLSYEDKKKQRQERSEPILDAFFSWVKTHTLKVAPKSKLGKAFYYATNEEIYLRKYTVDGRLEIDNNRAERSIKPFVMGRKNFLFANTPSGAGGSAIMYSIIETAKENNLNPYEYLNYIFHESPNLNKGEDLDILLPWNAPPKCRVK